jgi:hypothetical protein
MTTERLGERFIAISGLGLLATLAWAAPKVQRAHERRHYRRAYADNLSTTQKIPVVSMKDLVYK